MAWGIEQLGQRRSPSVAFDPELWTKLGEKYRGRQYAQDVVGAMQSVEGTGEEANEKRLRAMAEKYAAFDPAQAQNWISAADQIRERIEARKQMENQFTRGQDLGREQMQYNQGKEAQKREIDEIDSLAVQYRNARNTMASPNWNALNDDVKEQTANELNGIAEILKRSERGRALMGEVEKEEPQATPKEPTTEQPKTLALDVEGAKATLKGMAIDKDLDGQIDNVADFRDTLESIIQQSGLGEKDPSVTRVRKYADELASAIAKKAEFKEKKRGEARQTAAQEFTAYKDYLPAIQTVRGIESNPSQTNTLLGISELLKILSGTGVSDSERINTILALTSEDYQRSFRTQSEAYKNAFISKLVNNDQAILAEVSSNAQPGLVKEQLEKRIPKQSFDWFYKTQGVSKEPAKPEGTAGKKGAMEAWIAKQKGAK